MCCTIKDLWRAYGVLIYVTDVTDDTTPFGRRAGHKILAQDIKIV
jgi:hypothetical protein